MRSFAILGAVLLLAGVSAGYGQVNTTAGAHVPDHGRVNAVNERENTILKTLNDAAQTGALGPSQIEDFKRRYNQIQAQKINDMSQHHGHLSKDEVKDLKKQEDQLAHDIEASRSKH